MFWTLSNKTRRQKLSDDAERSRASRARLGTAIGAVIVYNIVGVADIFSTVIALDSGAGVEANPFLRTLMTHIGDAWVLAKLALQAVITGMVLWFPHWIVLGMFSFATVGNAWIVYNNFTIAGIL